VKKILFIILIFILLTLHYSLWYGTGSVFDMMRLGKTLALQTEEIQTLEIRNSTLRAEVKALKTYPQAFEERARLEHGMIKPGETFCLIVEK